jgi:hypothetical protein
VVRSENRHLGDRENEDEVEEELNEHHRLRPGGPQAASANVDGLHARPSLDLRKFYVKRGR